MGLDVHDGVIGDRREGVKEQICIPPIQVQEVVIEIHKLTETVEESGRHGKYKGHGKDTRLGHRLGITKRGQVLVVSGGGVAVDEGAGGALRALGYNM